MSAPAPAQWLGLGVALGAGLLIGLERERRKGCGPARASAGIRSFTLAALLAAWVAGGPRFALRVVPPLLLQLAAAWLVSNAGV